MRVRGIVLFASLALGITSAAHSGERTQYQPLVSTLSTSTRTTTGLATVGWMILSNVDAVSNLSLEAAKALPRGSNDGSIIYRYTYTFENTSTLPVRLNLSDPHVANSPLTEILNDFSFTLAPGQKRTIQFLAPRDPRFVVSPVNNAILTEGEWGVLGTRPASLYVPAWTGGYFVEQR